MYKKPHLKFSIYCFLYMFTSSMYLICWNISCLNFLYGEYNLIFTKMLDFLIFSNTDIQIWKMLKKRQNDMKEKLWWCHQEVLEALLNIPRENFGLALMVWFCGRISKYAQKKVALFGWWPIALKTIQIYWLDCNWSGMNKLNLCCTNPWRIILPPNNRF